MPRQIEQKPKNFKKSISKLAKYLKTYKVGIIIVLIFSILSTIFAIKGPSILGDAVTEIYKGLINKVTGMGGMDFTKITNILITLLILYILSALFNYIQGFIMNTISVKVSFNLRKDISKKINKLPLSYFDKKTHGEVLSIVTNDVDTLASNLSQSLSQIITSITTLVGVFIIMLQINVTMTLVSLLILPISLFGVGFIVKKSQKLFKRQQNKKNSKNTKR